MASGIFTILKNVSVLMDDTAAMTKIALKDTVGVLGDDLAVNAEKASKFTPSRELPVLFKITKGSIINKIILIPLLLTISYFLPFLVNPILILGALFLSYEGIHGILEILENKKENTLNNEISNNDYDVKEEENKINSAILTDRILSIEIIIIALNSVINKPFIEQIFIVSVVAFIATVGVYGIVALIIRFDDIGIWFIKKSIHNVKNKTSINLYKMFIGNLMINSMSKIIKWLTYIGITAMFLVAGEILLHKIHFFHNILDIHNSFVFIPAISLAFFLGSILVFFEKTFKKLKK